MTMQEMDAMAAADQASFDQSRNQDAKTFTAVAIIGGVVSIVIVVVIAIVVVKLFKSSK